MKDILPRRIASHLMSQCCGVIEERTAGLIQKEHSDPEDLPPTAGSVYSSTVQLISADLRSRVRCSVKMNFNGVVIRSLMVQMEKKIKKNLYSVF